MEDLIAKLADIEEAISKIYVGGQEYTIGSRRLRRPELSVLLAERKRIQEELKQRDDTSGGMVLARFTGR